MCHEWHSLGLGILTRDNKGKKKSQTYGHMYRKTDVRAGCVHSGELASHSPSASSVPYKDVFIDKRYKFTQKHFFFIKSEANLLADVISSYHFPSHSLPLCFHKGRFAFAVQLLLDINPELVPHFLEL